MNLKKIFISIIAVLFTACSFDDFYNKQANAVVESAPKVKKVSKIEMPKAKAKPILNEDRPVDIAPLVSNYIAARLSQFEGAKADAAFFYDRAENADPQNDKLKEVVFSLQLILGNMEEALRLAKSLVYKNDVMPITYILLIADSIKTGDLDKAKHFISKAQEISPNLLQFNVLNAYIELEQGVDCKQIITRLKSLPKIQGLNAIRHYHIARIYEKSGKLQEAIKEYEIALEIDKNSPSIILALEGIYERTNNKQKVKDLLTTFMKNNPDNLMLISSVERVKNNLPYTTMEKTLRQDTAGVIFEITTLMAKQRLYETAVQVLNISKMLADDTPFIKFYRAMISERVAEYRKSPLELEKAKEYYKEIKKGDYTWVSAQVRIAAILEDEKKFSEAIKIIKGLEKEYNKPILKRLLAGLYYRNGDYKKAIDIYNSLLAMKNKRFENSFWLYFSRGTSYERLAEYEKAEKDLVKSIDIKPNNPVALNYLAYMWIENDKNIDKAYNLIVRAIKILPDDASILDSMGWVLYKKDETKKALLFLKQADKQKPNDPTINMHLGDVYEKLGRLEDAYEHWNTALKLKPETKKDIKHIKSKLSKLSAGIKK